MEVEGWTVNVGQDGEVGGGEAPFLSGLSPSDCPPLSYDPIEGEKTPEEEKKREKKEKKKSNREREEEVPPFPRLFPSVR